MRLIHVLFYSVLLIMVALSVLLSFMGVPLLIVVLVQNYTGSVILSVIAGSAFVFPIVILSDTYCNRIANPLGHRLAEKIYRYANGNSNES